MRQEYDHRLTHCGGDRCACLYALEIHRYSAHHLWRSDFWTDSGMVCEWNPVLHENSLFTIAVVRGSASAGGLCIIGVSLCAGSAGAVPDGYRTNPPGACSGAELG